MTTPLRVLPTKEAIGEHVAGRILAGVRNAGEQGRKFLLGCPTGRTPRPIYAELARRAASESIDVSHVVLVLMDEYLVTENGRLVYASADHPWSCHSFARLEIAGALNSALPPKKRLPDESIWFPDPNDPDEYEARIEAAGGIDFFMLASGASDGHVAFNPPGSPRDSRTRIIPLSEATRRDNLQTFPTFGSLDAVPHHGISVGIATIAAAREASMIVWGASKTLTLQRIVGATEYEADWPATLIHECAGREVVADREAAVGI